MGNIADEYLILLFAGNLLFRGFLQAETHLLKGLAQFPDFVLFGGFHMEIQVAVLDVLGSRLQFADGVDNSLVNPDGQHAGGKDQNQHDRNQQIY